jgi:UDP-2-acetamido-2,6-beta-L-arabino-hexul-4-ose reductase
MKLLITGSEGFIGAHLLEMIKKKVKPEAIFEFNYPDDFDEAVAAHINEVTDIIHLAGVMDDKPKKMIYQVNYGLTKQLVDLLIFSNRDILFTSSSSWAAQAAENDYGMSKLLAEQEVARLKKGVNLRIHNVFGPGAKPFYKSVVATFSYQILHNQSLTINNPDAKIDFIYIDDLCERFIEVLEDPKEFSGKIVSVEKRTAITIGDLARMLEGFLTMNKPPVGYFEKRMWETFWSYEKYEV